jgi:hypothetical protein
MADAREISNFFGFGPEADNCCRETRQQLNSDPLGGAAHVAVAEATVRQDFLDPGEVVLRQG